MKIETTTRFGGRIRPGARRLARSCAVHAGLLALLAPALSLGAVVTVPPYIAAHDYAPPGMVLVDDQLNHASACTILPLDGFGVKPNGSSFSVRSRCQLAEPNVQSFIDAGWGQVNNCGNYAPCQTYHPAVVSKAPTCPPGYSVLNGACGTSGETAVVTHKAKRNKPCKPCAAGRPRPPLVVGNPINPLTGNKAQTEVDYASPLDGGLALVRTYNSRTPLPGIFGVGWATILDRRIEPARSFQGNTGTAVHRDDGAVFNFALVNSVWTGDSDINDRLEQLPSGWRYTNSSNDEVETYDVGGKLTSISTRAGLTLTLTYNTSGQLSQVADLFDRTLSFTFNTDGRVETVTDPASGVISYAYDTNGNLTSVTYPDNQIRTYHYENATYPNALTGITDEKARQRVSLPVSGASAGLLAASRTLRFSTGLPRAMRKPCNRSSPSPLAKRRRANRSMMLAAKSCYHTLLSRASSLPARRTRSVASSSPVPPSVGGWRA